MHEIPATLHLVHHHQPFIMDLSKLDSYSFAFHTIPHWNRILNDEINLPSDVADKIEDIIAALEYIKNWEPSDSDVTTHNSCGTSWHDGCR